VNAAAGVTLILLLFLLIKVDDDGHKMFMENYYSFQLLLNQENKELWDYST
jgi:hypothetical protein